MTSGFIKGNMHDFKNEGGIPSGTTPDLLLSVLRISSISNPEMCHVFRLRFILFRIGKSFKFMLRLSTT